MAADGSIVSWGSGEHGQTGQGKQGKVECVSEKIILQSIPQNEDVKISCGASYTVCVTNGNMYVWGNGSDGQLGTGALLSQYEPTKIALPVDIDQTPIAGVSCGARHTVLWTNDGLCYGFGANTHSQLPIKTDESQHIDTQTVPALLSAVQSNVVTQVSCGNRHTLFLYQCGTVASVGDNNHGQLGVGSRLACKTPQVLTGIEDVKLLATGADHSLAVTESGELYIWGYGKAVGYKHKDIVKPTKKLSHYTNIVQLAGGATHSLALTENGNVYSWGFGEDGQLGHGDEEKFLAKPTKITRDNLNSRICQICASDFLSAALSVDGAVYMWGNGDQVMPSHISSSIVYRPLNISLSDMSLCKISLGCWHATGVVGTYIPAMPSGDENGLQSRLDLPLISTPDNMSVCETPTSPPPNSADTLFYHNNSISNISTRPHSTTNSRASTSTPHTHREQVTSNNIEKTNQRQGSPLVNRKREKTSIADFYAPTPELTNKGHIVLGNNIVEEKENTEPNTELKLPAITTPAHSMSPVKSVRSSLKSISPRKSLQERSRAVSPEIHGSNLEDDDVPEIESTLPAVVITQTIRKPDPPPVVPPPDIPSPEIVQKRPRKYSDDGAIKMRLADPGPMTEEKPTVKAWNPHRNSLFNSHVFNNDKPQGMNAKTMGFLDMSDIQLVEKPVSKLTKTDLLTERHAKLYSKEMEMRSNLIAKHNTNYKNLTSLNNKLPGVDTMTDEMILRRLSTQYPMLGRHPTMNVTSVAPPGQKATRRTQVNKQRSRKAPPAPTPEELESLNVGLTQLPVPARNMLNREHHYHSAPTVVNNRRQYVSDSVLYNQAAKLLARKGGRPILPSTPDFSKAMTKLDIIPSKGKSLKHS